MISLLILKVFLVDVDSIILFHTTLYSRNESLHSILKVLILLNLNLNVMMKLIMISSEKRTVHSYNIFMQNTSYYLPFYESV